MTYIINDSESIIEVTKPTNILTLDEFITDKTPPSNTTFLNEDETN